MIASLKRKKSICVNNKIYIIYYISMYLVLISMIGCANYIGINNLSELSEKEDIEEDINDYRIIAIFTSDYKLKKEIKYHEAGSDWEIYESYIKGYPESDTLVGDFNGDGQQDTAWFTRSETIEYYIKNRACIGSFEFSNKKIRPLKLGNCCGGTFKNEGDLDDNGTDEIGVMCYDLIGGCRDYYVFSYINNEWKIILPPIETSLSMREAGIVLVEKDEMNKGYITIRNILWFLNDSLPKEYQGQGGGSCAKSNVIEYQIKVYPPIKHNNF